MARLALGAPSRATGHRFGVASAWLSPVLDLEEPTSHGPAGSASRCPRIDSRNVHSESAVGRTRIHGELQKLGISVSQSTVATFMRRPTTTTVANVADLPDQSRDQILAADLFVVPTVTFRLLFVLVILAHDRRQIVHVAVTEHPTAAWTAQQLRNAFSEDETPRYLLHDRDSVFADVATTIAG